MSESPATHVYARALFEAAGDKAPAVADELDSLVASIAAEPATWASLTAPGVSTDAQRAVVDSIATGSSDTARNFLRVLVDHGRLGELVGMAAELRELVKVQLHQLDVHITTAVDLPEALRAKLEARLSGSTGNKVTLHTSVDPAIIGGLVVQHGDTLIDTSLRSRLEDLRLDLTRPGAARPS